MRALLPKLLAVALGCVLAVGVLEVALRVLGLAPPGGIGSVNETDFERVPGLLTPGQELVDLDKPALPYHVRINTLGYRGEDFAREKAAGELRLLAVGDSFTYGDFVDGHETLPYLLEAGLRERCDGAVQVVNAGIGGSTIVTHTEMVKRALSLEPDAVLLTFSENDVFDLSAPLWYSLEENRRAKSRLPMSVLYPVLRHTALWNFALKMRATLFYEERHDEMETEQDSEAAEARRRERQVRLRADYAERLAALNDLLEARGIPLLYALYPSHHAVSSDDRTEQMQWVQATGEGLGLPTVSLLADLRATGEPMDVLYLLPEDGHPSPLGYRVAAATLLREVDWVGVSGGRCR